jgi:hypothetical protein
MEESKTWARNTIADQMTTRELRSIVRLLGLVGPTMPQRVNRLITDGDALVFLCGVN